MKDNHRSLLAAGLSFLVLIGWYFFYGSKNMPGNSPKTSTPAAISTPSPEKIATAEVTTQSPSDALVQPETFHSKETPVFRMKWTSHGGRLSEFLLKKYSQTVKKDSPPVNLLPFEGERSLQLLCKDCNVTLPADNVYSTVEEGERKIRFRAESEGLRISKTYEWSEESYVLNLKVTLENFSEKDFRGRLGMGWRAKQFPNQKSKGFFSFLQGPAEHRSLLYRLEEDVEHVSKPEQLVEIQGRLPWAGIEDRYFLISFIPQRVSSDDALKFWAEGDFLNLALYPSEVVVPPQGRHEETYSFYLGPKKRDELMVANVGLEKAVDYGWFSVLAIPILKLLQIFHMGVRNWGLAVIFLTLFIKLLMNPLTVKSMKQMKEMQKLQPKLTALKEKYKNDRQRLNGETMALFRSHNVNPVGGCLPMVLQMPIYIALYKVLYNAIEFYHAPFVGFYKDLSAPDPYFILPILLGVAMVLQQKMTPNPSADNAQRQMMMIMPVMFTAFMLFLPMGLVLYIFVNTIFSVLQQWMYQNDVRWRDLLRLRLRKETT